MPCNQGFTSAWRSVEQHTLAVFDSVFLDDALRIATRVECSSENFGKLCIKAADTERVEAYVFFENLLNLIADNLDSFRCVFANVARNHSFVGHLSVSLAYFLLKRLNFCDFYFYNEFAVTKG